MLWRSVYLLEEPAFLLWLPSHFCARLTYHEPVRTDQDDQEKEQRHGELQILQPDCTAPNKVNRVPEKPTTIPIEPVMSIVFSTVSPDYICAFIASRLHDQLR